MLWEKAFRSFRCSTALIRRICLKASHCSWNGENAWGAEFCYRHLEPMFISKQMSYKNPPAQLEEMLENRLIEQWTLAIESMYDDWEAEVSEDGEAALALERMAYEAALEGMEDGPDKAVWIEQKGISLCQKVYGTDEAEESEGETP